MEQLKLPFVKHIMVDLETLGTRPGDAILSIGAVVFDRNGISDEFYVAINPSDSKALGFKSQKSTIEWWGKQSPEAKQAAFSGTETVKGALDSLDVFIRSQGYVDIRVWGNGADFDNAMLSAAFNLVKMEIPWKFWNNRCYRTIKSQYPAIKLERTGTYHNALDDAKSQTVHLLSIVESGNLTDLL